MNVELNELQREYNSFISPERRVEIIRRVQEMSLEVMPENVCTVCKQAVVQIEDERPWCEGHIYSQDGADEFFISKSCEWCFDKMFLEPDDPRRAEWFGEG